jgi:hypothetical protein
MILPFHSARMCATAVMSHMMTRKIVRALQMPLMPGLFRAEPTWMAARVRPALGKTNWGGRNVRLVFLSLRGMGTEAGLGGRYNLLPTNSE